MEIVFTTELLPNVEGQVIFTLIQNSGIYIGVKHLHEKDEELNTELDVFINKELLSDVIGALLHLQSKLKNQK